MNTRPTLCASCILLAALATRALAEEHVVEKHNFAIDLPDGDRWELVEPAGSTPGMLFQIAVGRDDGKTLIVRVSKAEGPVDEAKFQEGFRRGALRTGWRLVDEGRRTVGGVPAVTLRLEGRDEPAAMAMASFLADDRHYGVVAVAPGEDADPDPEFTRAVDSFRFLRKPKLPKKPDLAFQIGYVIGYLALPALLVVVLVSYARRRQAKRRAA